MGFRKDSYATVWQVTPKTESITNLRVSISRKDRSTGEYVTDFSGFIDCIGKDVAGKALSLKEKDRIQIGDCDVSNSYNKETGVTYTNFKIFSFKSPAELNSAQRQPAPDDMSEFLDVPEGDDDEGLPF